MKEKIRSRAIELGFSQCRFTTAAPPDSGAHFQAWLAGEHQGTMSYLARTAPKRLQPDLVLPGARSVICLATSYFTPPIPPPANPSANEPAPPAGLIARYARSTDYHQALAEPLQTLANFLQTLGGPEHRSLWYADTGPILERDLAQRAGIGFIGKHTNLISRSHGNWILLSEILTTLDLPPDSPETNRCGRCTRCIAACPTEAITAPFQLDARRCISYLTIELKGSIPVELRPSIGNRIFGCDDCLAACPWNRFAQTAALLKPHARPDLETPDLLQLLELDEPAFKQRFANTPLLRPKRKGLLRNVCVALGNTAGPEAQPALQLAAHDPEPLIAEHAQWALQQIHHRHPSSVLNPQSPLVDP